MKFGGLKEGQDCWMMKEIGRSLEGWWPKPRPLDDQRNSLKLWMATRQTYCRHTRQAQRPACGFEGLSFGSTWIQACIYLGVQADTQDRLQLTEAHCLSGHCQKCFVFTTCAQESQFSQEERSASRTTNEREFKGFLSFFRNTLVSQRQVAKLQQVSRTF